MEQCWLWQDGVRLLLMSCPRSTTNPLRCLGPCLISRVRAVVIVTHRAVKRLAVPVPLHVPAVPVLHALLFGVHQSVKRLAQNVLVFLTYLTPSTVYDDDVDDDAQDHFPDLTPPDLTHTVPHVSRPCPPSPVNLVYSISSTDVLSTAPMAPGPRPPSPSDVIDSGNSPSRGKYIPPRAHILPLVAAYEASSTLQSQAAPSHAAEDISRFPSLSHPSPSFHLLSPPPLLSHPNIRARPSSSWHRPLGALWVQPSGPSSRVSRRVPVDVPSPISASCSALPVRPSAAPDLFSPTTPATLSPCFPFLPPPSPDTPLPNPSRDHDLPSSPALARPMDTCPSPRSPSRHKTSSDSLLPLPSRDHVVTSPPRARPSLSPDPSLPTALVTPPSPFNPSPSAPSPAPPPSPSPCRPTIPFDNAPKTRIRHDHAFGTAPHGRPAHGTVHGTWTGTHLPCTSSPTQSQACAFVWLGPSPSNPNFHGVAVWCRSISGRLAVFTFKAADPVSWHDVCRRFHGSL